MTSLRSLLAAYEGQDASPASASIAALEKMVALQKDALDQALDDLQAARLKHGLAPIEPTAVIGDSASVAAFIARAHYRALGLGLEPLDFPPPPQLPPAPPSTPQARADVVAFIVAADKKARNEK